MLDLFKPSHVKRGQRVLEAVKKFVAYNRDLMAPEALQSIETARDSYRATMETRNKDNMAAEEEKLKKVCDKALPGYKVDAIKENVEVVIVAIVVALGIRAYIAQPFKIPTSSMQPTLNGLIGVPMGKDESSPNPVTQAWQYVWRGSNYTALRAPQGSGSVAITSISQKSVLGMFVTRTVVGFSDGSSSTCYAPAKQLLRDLWLDNEQAATTPLEARGPSGHKETDGFQMPVEDFAPRQVNIPVTPGALLAAGHVDTGDQLLVDKVSYHFRAPKRGEVFVFNTMGIQTGRKSNAGPPPSAENGQASQHYIKRLVGTPNDKLTLAPPQLLVDGQPATAPGMVRVMAHEGNDALSPQINKYHGYTLPGGAGKPLTQKEASHEELLENGSRRMQYNLKDNQYFAMGDNSGNSLDSRYWGAVPEQNLVGPALLVYWPFSPHWGLIK